MLFIVGGDSRRPEKDSPSRLSLHYSIPAVKSWIWSFAPAAIAIGLVNIFKFFIFLSDRERIALHFSMFVCLIRIREIGFIGIAVLGKNAKIELNRGAW